MSKTAEHEFSHLPPAAGRLGATFARPKALAIACVLALVGLGWPAAWALPLLPKVTPGIGVVWFLVRREWRSLAIAVGLGIAVCTAVIVWGGIEKTLAGANSDAEHRAQKRITNGIMGLVWMVVASVVVSVITAIAVAYGLIDKPF